MVLVRARYAAEGTGAKQIDRKLNKMNLKELRTSRLPLIVSSRMLVQGGGCCVAKAPYWCFRVHVVELHQYFSFLRAGRTIFASAIQLRSDYRL
jgi:hypothetical protein